MVLVNKRCCLSISYLIGDDDESIFDDGFSRTFFIYDDLGNDWLVFSCLVWNLRWLDLGFSFSKFASLNDCRSLVPPVGNIEWRIVKVGDRFSSGVICCCYQNVINYSPLVYPCFSILYARLCIFCIHFTSIGFSSVGLFSTSKDP